MSLLIDAAEVIEREGVRLKALIDAAAVLRDSGSLQQAADEATKRRDDMAAEAASLSAKLPSLRQDVADATGKADQILADAQARADKILADANVAAADAAQVHLEQAIADVKANTQLTVAASEQAVTAAQLQLKDLATKVAAMEQDASDRYVSIEKMQSDKEALEAALASIKAKFQ